MGSSDTIRTNSLGPPPPWLLYSLYVRLRFSLFLRRKAYLFPSTHVGSKRHPPLSDPLVDENGPMVLGEDRLVFLLSQSNRMELFKLPMTSDPPTLFLVFIFSSSSIVFLHSLVFILREKNKRRKREGGKHDFFLPPIGKEKIYPSTSARREDIRLSLLTGGREEKKGDAQRNRKEEKMGIVSGTIPTFFLFIRALI